MAIRTKLLEIEREAIMLDISQIASYLQDALGQKVVAYLAGLSDTKMVRAWVRGASRPHPMTERRLRYAYHAARLLDDAYGKELAQTWFFGTNHFLDYHAPAYVLRHAQTPEEAQDIVPAAGSFVETAG